VFLSQSRKHDVKRVRDIGFIGDRTLQSPQSGLSVSYMIGDGGELERSSRNIETLSFQGLAEIGQDTGYLDLPFHYDPGLLVENLETQSV